ncbi:hypothetical protein LY76DRAFT_591328 [Colletotrichum caudatum]|nr:hypothetical protein LY76DRAFT_591328 [Colletotrichum caudatum]
MEYLHDMAIAQWTPPHPIADGVCWSDPASPIILNPSIPHVPDKLISPGTHQSLLGSCPLLPPIWQVVM